MQVDTVKEGGHAARIVLDEYPENPRTAFDNVGRMVSFYDREYSRGDEQLPESWGGDKGDGRGDARRRRAVKRLYERREGAAVFLWIRHTAYDSTLTVIEDGERADGFIYCTAEQVAHEWGDRLYPDGDGKTPLERAESYLRGEVSDASAYYSGDVYTVEIEGDEDEGRITCYGREAAEDEALMMARAAARAAHDSAMREVIEAARCERMMHV